MSQDPFAEFKLRQQEMWASFGPTALFTTPVAGHVVRFARIVAGEAVLDVGTGTGVLAIMLSSVVTRRHLRRVPLRLHSGETPARLPSASAASSALRSSSGA